MDTVFQAADILLPEKTIDMEKWSVIACDQFTSEPEYWEKVKANVAEHPSTLDMILPEVYLGHDDHEKQLKTIEQMCIRDRNMEAPVLPICSDFPMLLKQKADRLTERHYITTGKEMEQKHFLYTQE